MKNQLSACQSLREKCPYSELFWSAFSVSFRIQSECGKMRTRIIENTDTFYAVSVQSNYSKIYENIFHNQITPNFDNFFSKYETFFRKGFNPKNCLVAMMEKSSTKQSKNAVLLTDLWKLHAYDFDMQSLGLMQSYLTNI